MRGPSRRLAWTVVVREEIEELHRFFQEWFLGERPETGAEFARLETALAPGFSLVGPRGAVMEREEVLAWIRDAYGSRCGETFRIWVRSVQLRDEAERRLLASYEEWQETEDGVTVRLSTAWFALAPGDEARRDRLRWLHVHETWRADRAPVGS